MVYSVCNFHYFTTRFHMKGEFRFAKVVISMKQIPNILTVFRLILTGVFAYLFFNTEYLLSFIVYLVAFFTDILDGYLARRNNWITNVGKVLDPFVDKLMLMTVLFCFYSVRAIPLYMLILIIGIESIMIIVSAILYFKRVVVYADWFGKIATGLFLFSISMTFVNLIWNAVDWYIYFYIAAVVSTIVAFFHYGIKTFIKKKS